jgi:hydroxymethylpyrimidine/phosphomethylpyrimidine kinase
MAETPPIVLTIAGFDPCSGAGITADVKTIAAHGCYGIACITALTVQSTTGVRRVEPLAPELVTETLAELFADLDISAVHVGMLANRRVAAVVADFLSTAGKNVVLDPILRSSSGAELLDPPGVKLLKEKLIPLATVITPNTDEAFELTGIRISDVDGMKQAAHALHGLGALAVVVTGGHLNKAIDLLSFTGPRGIEQEVFKADRQKSNSTHGTGCAFATAMACHLAQDRGLPEAVLLAKAYVATAISNAHPLGRGVGPPDHLYRMKQLVQRRTLLAEPEHVR